MLRSCVRIWNPSPVRFTHDVPAVSSMLDDTARRRQWGTYRSDDADMDALHVCRRGSALANQPLV